LEWWNDGRMEGWNVEDPVLSGGGKMEWWKNGMVKEWKNGMMEEWNGGILEYWDDGRMEWWKRDKRIIGINNGT